MKRLLTLMAGPLAALLVVIAAVGLLPQGAAAEPGEPPAGTTQSIQTYVLYATSAITEDGTIYSDAQQFLFWNAADLFVTADVASSAVVTVTAQVSPDGTNFTDADYQYVDADELLTGTYQRVLSADGTEYMRLPMAGEWLRVSIETSGNVTPTIQATMRNN